MAVSDFALSAILRPAALEMIGATNIAGKNLRPDGSDGVAAGR
jgi:hypothetical protein